MAGPSGRCRVMHAAGTLAGILAIAVILSLPSLTGWLRAKRATRQERRGHPWCCDCRERRQDARSRHPSGQAMDSASRGMWAELDAFEAAADWDRRSAEAESFSARNEITDEERGPA